MRLLSSGLLLLLFLAGCTDSKAPDYYPEKDSSMASGLYDKYKVKLDTAYLNDDRFEIGVQLSNLKAPKAIIFKEIEAGIRQDKQACYRIYDWYAPFREANFQTNLVKADTNLFLQSFDLCLQLLGNNTYDDYQSEKKRKHAETIAQRAPMDSTKFDQVLRQNLINIRESDQRYRALMNKKDITKEETEALWKKQNYLDSINLIKVDRILKTSGFPTKNQVGYEATSAIWLVLQHQADLDTRNRYTAQLEAAAAKGKLSQGHLNAFKKRTEYIQLNQTSK